MHTAEEQLQWAVNFAQRDLSALREGDWLNLYDDLDRFCGLGVTMLLGAHERIITTPQAPPGGLTRDAVRALQVETQRVLETVADWNANPAQPVPGAAAARGGVAASVTLRGIRAVWVPPPVGALMFEGAAGDMVCVRLFLILSDGDHAARVLRCPAVPCRRLFLRVRRQRYCSRKCVNRANARAKRAHDRAAQAGGERRKTTGTARGGRGLDRQRPRRRRPKTKRRRPRRLRRTARGQRSR